MLAAVFCMTFLPSRPFAESVPDLQVGHADGITTLSNGILTAEIDTNRAMIQSLEFQGKEFVKQNQGGIYYSMDGGSRYHSPSGHKAFIHHQSQSMIDIGMRSKWDGTRAQAVDCEIHYVMHRGDSGIYTYAILQHPSTYPETQIGEWRMVWKLPDDLLDTIFVDSMRYRQMPTAEDFAHADRTPIAEIVKLTSGRWKGRYDCKYDYNAEYHKTPFWGHADRRSGLGAWMVFGAHEWFNDGPTKQDLTSADRILHVHFGMNHYNGSSTKIADGESWRKIYGPFLLYTNQTDGGTDQAVLNVRKRAELEKSRWPYTWLTGHSDYPPSHGRGRVTGCLTLSDPAKPSLTSAGAWVGLAQPDATGNWQFESKRYQYWTRTSADGTFQIPHVRPGKYRLSAYLNGVFEEFELEDVESKAGQSTNLGTIPWRIARTRGRLLWEIGTPDRSAAEFRHGDDYFQGYLWQQFAKEWPNPLNFTIGSSNPAKDWNYAHTAYPKKTGGDEPWKWQIHFELERAPLADATLTIGIASADRARLHVHANAQAEPVAVVNPSVQGGNALLREAIHAKYCYHRVSIPASALHPGKNMIALVQARIGAPRFHVMYDALSLEVP